MKKITLNDQVREGIAKSCELALNQLSSNEWVDVEFPVQFENSQDGVLIEVKLTAGMYHNSKYGQSFIGGLPEEMTTKIINKINEANL